MREVGSSISGSQKTFFGKDQRVDISDVVGHMVSVHTTQFCPFSVKSPKQKTSTLHRQYISEWACLCSKKAFHGHWNLNFISCSCYKILFRFFQPFKNMKTILSSQATQNRWQDPVGQWAVVRRPWFTLFSLWYYSTHSMNTEKTPALH